MIVLKISLGDTLHLLLGLFLCKKTTIQHPVMDLKKYH